MLGLDCVERLLLVDASETDGLTALHLATIGGPSFCQANFQISRCFSIDLYEVKRGFLQKKSLKKETALMTSTDCWMFEGHNSICSALLDGRADVDARSAQLDTPLMWAAHLGHSSVCQLLLKRGADASLKNASGQTAVTWSGLETAEDV